VLSRIAFLRIAAVTAVLTVTGVAGAKMGHHNSAALGEAQPAEAAAPADAAPDASAAAVHGRALFPLGVPPGLAARAQQRTTAQPSAVAHLRDLDQLRTAGAGATAWPTSRRSGRGASAAFGGHGFAGAGASFGSVGSFGGRASSSAATKSAATSPAAVKTPGTAKTPAPPSPAAPRAPSSAAPAAPPAPVTTAPSLTAPVADVSVAPPLFASQIAPIPVIAGGSPASDPAPLAGVAGGGSVASRGPSLSPTPEPGSLLLIVTGLAAVIGASRRRQRTP
jgi:hypothetical protein